MIRTLATLGIAGLLAACGGSPATATNPSSPTPVANTTPTPSPSPSPDPTPAASPTPSPAACAPDNLCTGRAATAAEQAAMIAAGKSAFEQAYGLKDASACASGDDCFSVNSPSGATVGTNAGYFRGEEHRSPSGGGAGCVVYLSQDSTGWHYVSGGCAQGTGYLPGIQDRVFVTTACARVRALPSLSGKVLDCLPRGFPVDVDSAPVYADGYIWWHLQGRGWMAHDFLLWPKGVEK